MRQKGSSTTHSRATHATPPETVARYLTGAEYPADPSDLLTTARQNSAPKEVIDFLEDLPDQVFAGPEDVMKAYS